MQKLHLVGFTTDRRGLIFSVRRGAKSGGYVIDVGEEIFGAVDDARARMEEEAAEADADERARELEDARPQSALSVREIQSRLRQGRSIDAVAKDAGVEVEWVSRFAAPVLTELAEVVRSVKSKRYVKQRVGVSGATLAESVYRNLVERGVSTPREELDRAWTARLLPDGEWEIRFAYVSRGRHVVTSWAFDEVTGKVRGRDRLAGQLAFRPGGSRSPKRPKKAAGAAAVADAAAESDDEPLDDAKAVRAAARRMATARKAARARMVADAEKATKRNARAMRKAAARPLRPRLIPPPSNPELFEPPLDELDQVGDLGGVDDIAREPELLTVDDAGDLEDEAEVEADADTNDERDEGLSASADVQELGDVPDADAVPRQPARRREPLRARPRTEPVVAHSQDVARPGSDGVRPLRLSPRGVLAGGSLGDSRPDALRPAFREDLARRAGIEPDEGDS